MEEYNFFISLASITVNGAKYSVYLTLMVQRDGITDESAFDAFLHRYPKADSIDIERTVKLERSEFSLLTGVTSVS